MVKAMHSQCKVPKEDLPISVKFLPSKDATGETCSCIVRYAKEETLEHVLQEMAGRQIQLKSGKIKKIGVKRARPARWMIEAGLAKDAEQPKKQKAAKDWRDWDEVGSKEPLDQSLEHEGTMIQWYSQQASGFIRSIDGVEAFAPHQNFLNLDRGEEPLLGMRVTFQATWNEDRQRYDARKISLMKPTEQFPDDLPDGPPISAPGRPQEYEASEGLDYFCKLWYVTAATRRWLHKLHPEVQDALMNEYDESTLWEPPDPSEEVTLHPSSSVAVASLTALGKRW